MSAWRVQLWRHLRDLPSEPCFDVPAGSRLASLGTEWFFDPDLLITDFADLRLGGVQLSTYANLAQSYRSAGGAPKAIELLQRVLADMEHILGDDHPDTLTARQTLKQWRTGRAVRVKPGRNELCPCGSGTKFKRCCGR